MTKLAELGWGKSDQAFRQFFTTQFIPGGTPEQHHWFNEHERISTSPKNAASLMREFARIDVVALLPRVQCPTLVLHSRHDMRVPFAEGRLIAGAILGARFVAIESSNPPARERAGWRRWIEEVRAFCGRRGRSGDRSPDRSPRELLDLIAERTTEIAAALGLSDKTVRNPSRASSPDSPWRTARRRSCARAKPASAVRRRGVDDRRQFWGAALPGVTTSHPRLTLRRLMLRGTDVLVPYAATRSVPGFTERRPVLLGPQSHFLAPGNTEKFAPSPGPSGHRLRTVIETALQHDFARLHLAATPSSSDRAWPACSLRGSSPTTSSK